MSKTKVSSRGQTVIPTKIREQYGIKVGSMIEWQPIDGQTISVSKAKGNQKKMDWNEWFNSAYGLHKEIWEGVDPVKYVRKQRQRSSH